MRHAAIAVTVTATLLLAGCGQESGSGGGSSGARSQIRIVGSSTVYPFSSAVAEQFVRNNPGMKAPIIESTGTGAGLKLFCAGVGTQHPDMANASRRIKKSEFEDCRKNGVNQIIELPVGIDGLALIEGKSKPQFSLTPADVYKALAATPFGKPNTAKTWKDVSPALPAVPIQVYGPPPTSGTRDAFAELIMEKGCESDPAMKALKESDKDKHKEVCTKVREDGAYIEATENDNLMVQKVAGNPGSIGILGYSFLEENADKVRGIPLSGVNPTSQTISSFEYPGARPLFVYVKGEHLAAIPGIREYIAEFAKGWGQGGYLTRRGLIASPADQMATANQTAKELKPMSGDELE
ncbi:MAG TPA: PstS family phosphate ABC transporter substrate-binding protein [Allosphingosinicella sp.]|nr:PstS family phosphate ABC transporter substrate-binding protein [Allosphingosinicella sp.]